MGIEYKIAFTHVTEDDTLDDILRSAPFFTEPDQPFGNLKYEYRLPDNSGSMPNAQAATESYGVYFCDFGGAGDIMARIVQQITERIASPTVSELE